MNATKYKPISSPRQVVGRGRIDVVKWLDPGLGIAGLARLVVFAFCLLSLRLAHASSDAYYQYLQGLVEERAGNMQKALSHYEKVVAEDPQAVEAYRDIAQLNM